MRARVLAFIFALYGAVAIALLAVIIPPFQHAEEGHHFMRANQVARFAIIGTRFEKPGPSGPLRTAGGLIDPALVAAAIPFVPLVFHAEVKATRSMWAPPRLWTGNSVMKDFPNTVVYSPLFYLQAALAIRIGQAARFSVTQTLVLARLLTGFACIALGAIAIAMAEATAIWIFAILTLPMSLDLMASVSQDALLLACTALVAALIAGAVQAGGRMRAALPVATVLCATIGLAKPPYLPFAALLVLIPGTSRTARALACAVPPICTAAWLTITAMTDLTNFGGVVGADPHTQLMLILAHPLLLLAAIGEAVRLEWLTLWQQAIGVLGWLDTPLPDSYYWMATIVLGMAASATTLGPAGLAPRAKCLTLACVAAALLLIFASLYVAWTPPGGTAALGVEGRYFLPVALIASLALPAFPSRLRAARAIAIATVTLFPILTLAVVTRTILIRYYLS